MQAFYQAGLIAIFVMNDIVSVMQLPIDGSNLGAEPILQTQAFTARSEPPKVLGLFVLH